MIQVANENNILPSINQITSCNVCRKIKDNNVPNLLCKHYICPACYCSMKMQKKEHCITCERVMIRRYPKY